MAQVVAAFGSSHSTMLVSSAEHWQEMFDRVDRRAPINDFDGAPRTFDELLTALPADAAAKIAKDAMAERHRATMAAMDRLERDIAASGIDVLVIIGDDQREMFKDALRPAIAVYYGETIRNAAAPAEPAADWYLQDQRKRMEDKEDRHYPCHPALATALIEGLVARIEGEFGGKMKVVATGGLAPLLAEGTTVIGHIDPDLTLDGLRWLAERNPVPTLSRERARLPEME